MMKKTIFIYCPKSGSRWINEAGPREGIKIPLVVWDNNSAHGHGQLISIWTATPRGHWRKEAREAADFVAHRLGGVAWDNQGQVNILVPGGGGARFALAAMWVVDPYGDRRVPLGEALRLGLNWNDARTFMTASDFVGQGLNDLFALWGWSPQEPPASEEIPITFSSPWLPVEIYGDAKIEKKHSCIYCKTSDSEDES